MMQKIVYNIVNNTNPRNVLAFGGMTIVQGGTTMKEIISGIYEIRNTVNGHRYIGSSNDISRRWNSHRSQLNRGKHPNNILQRAWFKYGESSFSFSTLLLVKERGELIKNEQAFLDKYRPEYNIALDATSPMLNRKHTGESKKKISESSILYHLLHPEAREGLIKMSTNRVKSEMEILKLRLANLGKRKSETAKANMSANRKDKRAVNQYTLSGEFIKQYESSHSASRTTGVPRSSICNCCNGVVPKNGLYIWRWVGSDIPPIYTPPVTGKAVRQYSKDMEFIGEYKSAHEADRITGVGFRCISSCCLEKRKSAGGYIWRYADKEVSNE